MDSKIDHILAWLRQERLLKRQLDPEAEAGLREFIGKCLVSVHQNMEYELFTQMFKFKSLKPFSEEDIVFREYIFVEGLLIKEHLNRIRNPQVQ